MENTEGLGGDALIGKLAGITDRLEDQIGAFKLIGQNIQGDIEHGFLVSSDEGVQDEGGDEIEEATE